MPSSKTLLDYSPADGNDLCKGVPMKTDTKKELQELQAKEIACTECGGSRFIQKEIRKTGVRLVNGAAVATHSYDCSPIILFICINCGWILPRDIAGKVKYKAQFIDEASN
jgi:predicted nucleic-acid-binding Zn-ribbon protein